MDKFKEICRRYGTFKVSVAISLTIIITFATLIALGTLVPELGRALWIIIFGGIAVGLFITLVYQLVEAILDDDF